MNRSKRKCKVGGRIENYEEVIEALEEEYHTLPDGERVDVIVENPSGHEGANPPGCLRVKGLNRGFHFDIIEKAAEFDLAVGDVWQLNDDHEAERVCYKLVPKERLFGEEDE
jgi:hypothetical protein